MMTIVQFQNILSDTLFMGNTEVGGMIIYAVVLGMAFAFSKKDFHTAIILNIPISLIFSLLGILSGELMLLLIVISVLALAMGAKRTFGD